MLVVEVRRKQILLDRNHELVRVLLYASTLLRLNINICVDESKFFLSSFDYESLDNLAIANFSRPSRLSPGTV